MEIGQVGVGADAEAGGSRGGIVSISLFLAAGLVLIVVAARLFRRHWTKGHRHRPRYSDGRRP